MLEMASLLGGEPFSDRPQCVCPALREFLHGYNDALPDDLRQDLYGLASDIVGSRTPPHLIAWRARLCMDWARSQAALDGRSPRFHKWTLDNCGLAGAYSARMARRDGWRHQQTVAFIRWLAHARPPDQLPAAEPTPVPDRHVLAAAFAAG